MIQHFEMKQRNNRTSQLRVSEGQGESQSNLDYDRPLHIVGFMIVFIFAN
jgi:hypothetical protein